MKILFLAMFLAACNDITIEKCEKMCGNPGVKQIDLFLDRCECK